MRFNWTHLRQLFTHSTEGGNWALSLPRLTRHNLRWFWYDGLFSAFSDNILLTYLNLFVLALGATPAQIGLMTSLSSLGSAVLLLPGALLVERFGHRKQLTLLTGGGVSRLALLGLAVAPMMLGGSPLIAVAMALVIGRTAMAFMSFPGWMALTSDMIPIEGRGRYFANRNLAMVLAGIIVVYAMGELITHTPQPLGYQLAIGLAFLFGACSTLSFARVKDPKGDAPAVSSNDFTLRGLWKDLVSDRNILAYNLIMALWNFSLNIAAPFFSLYQVQMLNASGTMVALISIASSVSSLVAQRRIGLLADRWGARKLQMISGLLIPLLPWLWIFITEAWQAIPINLFGGALWAAYSLAALNYLLEMAPSEKLARYAAINQIIVMAALAAGAAVGGLITNQSGYHAVFVVSGIGRLIAALLFVWLIRK